MPLGGTTDVQMPDETDSQEGSQEGAAVQDDVQEDVEDSQEAVEPEEQFADADSQYAGKTKRYPFTGSVSFVHKVFSHCIHLSPTSPIDPTLSNFSFFNIQSSFHSAN